MSDRTLHHDTVVHPSGQPALWLLVLHGIFGHGRNWHTVARRLTARRVDVGVVLVDLREHGRSVGFDPPHNLDSAAGDVRRLVAALELADHAVLGHSFGGKVALRYAADPPPTLRQAWMIDSTPDVVSTKNQGRLMLELLRRLPDRFASREDLIDAMTSFAVTTDVAKWMSTNLVRESDDPAAAYRWRFDLDDIEALLGDFYPATFWDEIEHLPGVPPLHFVRAASGSIMTDQAAARIRAAEASGRNVHLHEIPGDHWLNVSNPDALIDLLATHL